MRVSLSSALDNRLERSIVKNKMNASLIQNAKKQLITTQYIYVDRLGVVSIEIGKQVVPVFYTILIHTINI